MSAATQMPFTRADLARALAEIRAAERAAKAQHKAEERERRLIEDTVLVLREEGTWRRYCVTCDSEVVSICVRGREAGEILRCRNGHDCSERFRVRKLKV